MIAWRDYQIAVKTDALADLLDKEHTKQYKKKYKKTSQPPGCCSESTGHTQKIYIQIQNIMQKLIYFINST